jgi:hypothetical protein
MIDWRQELIDLRNELVKEMALPVVKRQPQALQPPPATSEVKIPPA